MNSILLMVLAFVMGGGLVAGEVRVTEADNGKKIELHVGDKMTVELQGNPTTGYTWKEESKEEPLLTPLVEEYATSSTLCGAGGTFSFTATAVLKGESHLHFVYLRPWETDSAPEKTFDITLSIHDDLSP